MPSTPKQNAARAKNLVKARAAKSRMPGHPRVETGGGKTWKTNAQGVPTHLYDSKTGTWAKRR